MQSRGLTYSISRRRMLEECPRKYLYHYYIARGGHRRDAAPTRRLSYRLKKLTTFALELGSGLHQAADRIAERVREAAQINAEGILVVDLDLPSLEDLQAPIRERLNRVVLGSRDAGGFERSPSQHPMLHSTYYRMNTTAEIERTRALLDPTTEALRSLWIWDEAALSPPEDVLTFDALEPVLYRGVRFYGAPDLAYRAASGRRIVDFKLSSIDGAHEQLTHSALYLRERGLIDAGESLTGIAISLETGEYDEIDIEPRQVLLADERARSAMSRMTDLLVDRDTARNEPVAAHRFERRPTPRCRWCPFYEICQPDEHEVDGPFTRIDDACSDKNGRAAGPPARSQLAAAPTSVEGT